MEKEFTNKKGKTIIKQPGATIGLELEIVWQTHCF